MDDDEDDVRPGFDRLAEIDAVLSRREPSCWAISNDSRRRGARRGRLGDVTDGELNNEFEDEDEDPLAPGENMLILWWTIVAVSVSPVGFRVVVVVSSVSPIVVFISSMFVCENI